MPAYREVATFFLRHFPAAVYRARWWWVAPAPAFVVVAVALGGWVAHNPDVQASIATPDEVRQLVDQDFASYYCSHPAGAFAAQVWTNNAWLSALRHRRRRAARHPDPVPAVAERGERRRHRAG